MTQIKDSGTRDEFDTGAVRDAEQGKGRFDLLPIDALFMLAKHFEAGAHKYADRNWEKGIPTHRFADSAMRHLLKAMRHDDDEDHLTAAAWNLLCMKQTRLWIERGELPESLETLPIR